MLRLLRGESAAMRSDARLVDVLRMARMRRSRTVHMDMVGRSRAVNMNPLRMHMAWVMAMMVMRSQMNDMRTARLAQGRINRSMHTRSTHRHINFYSSACLPSNNKKRSAGCNNHGFQYIRLHKKRDYTIRAHQQVELMQKSQKNLFFSRELLTLGHFQSRLALNGQAKIQQKNLLAHT